jgi:hypothetical protein
VKINRLFVVWSMVLFMPCASYGEGQERIVTDFKPAKISLVPAQVVIDYAQEKEAFSKFLFTFSDTAFLSEHGLKLAKEADFKAIALSYFFDEQTDPVEKARLLAHYGLEGVLVWKTEASGYLLEVKFKQKIDAMLDTLESLGKRYPGFTIKTFLFGHEPDSPFLVSDDDGQLKPVYWDGSSLEFLRNYAWFVKRLKARNKDYVVGTPGFAPDVFFPDDPGVSWVIDLIKHLSFNYLPVDFIAFHGFSSEVNTSFTARMVYLWSLMDKYPIKSPVFREAKLAASEIDLQALPLVSPRYFPELDTAWRAAHNIMALMALVDNGLWLAAEPGGPFPDHPGDTNFLWIKADGTIKPIYYAHKAFNALADTIRLEQAGGNFETFGALAGKAADGSSLVIVLASYDQLAFLSAYPDSACYLQPQSLGLCAYKDYTVTLKNLPWNDHDALIMERYLVDDACNFELAETTELKGNPEISISRHIGLPQVQLIKIRRK